ncbi:hypothetical protein BS47DRAFT_1364564 [Hydnum rufescens UP504]|uniref:Uncharacterized protein n=1 Tax=Hydnum rufescens UP504 TaxID=1448309 RepID=A0A9P6AR45_9AGAM|nr:hypothetical protein BS47DRAFT_1364564 [Hydnum rufescens UP504]
MLCPLLCPLQAFGSWPLGRDLRWLCVVQGFIRELALGRNLWQLRVMRGFVRELGPWPRSLAAMRRAGFVRELGPWPRSLAATRHAGFRSGVSPLRWLCVVRGVHAGRGPRIAHNSTTPAAAGVVPYLSVVAWAWGRGNVVKIEEKQHQKNSYSCSFGAGVWYGRKTHLIGPHTHRSGLVGGKNLKPRMEILLLVMMLKKYNKGSFGFPFCMAVHSGKELTYMTTHPLPQVCGPLLVPLDPVVESYIRTKWLSEEKRDSQLDCTKAACAKQNWATSMHYNWPKIEYLGGMYVFIIYLYEACAAPNWALFQARKVPALSSILTSIWRRPKQVPHTRWGGFLPSATQRMHRQDSGRNMRARTAAQDPKTQLSVTYRMMPATPASVDFLPPPNSPSEEHTDKAQAKYGGACSHLGPQPLCIPNPYNDESSTALHTRFGRFFLPPFEERTDNIHHEIRERTAAQTPTCNLYDNETRMAPHTCFGGDLHAAISDPMNAPTRRRVKCRSVQLPRPPTFDYPQCNLYDYATNTVPHTRQSGLDSFSLRETALKNTQTTPTPKYGSVLPPKTQTLDHPQVLSPYAKPHPKPAQMKAKAKYGCTQAPESPAPNTHGDRHNKLNMIPYAAAAGLFSHHETSPAQEYIDKAQGEIWVHTQPPKTTLKHLYTTTNRIRLSPSVKPPCDECTDKARANYGHLHSHARFQHSTIHNQYNDESNTEPHTRQSTFSHCETPPKASTDEAQGKILTYAATRKPSNRNEKLNTIPHTRFGGTVVDQKLAQ